MSYIKKRPIQFVVSMVVMFVMAIIASRQFYLFVMFRDGRGLTDTQGGRYHLWFAAGALLIAAIAAGLMFLFFLGREKSEHTEASSPLERQPDLINVKPDADSPAASQFNAVRWGQLNDWCVGGQADDRRQMNGSVGAGPGSASARRADARLAHQVMYKRWATERHD